MYTNFTWACFHVASLHFLWISFTCDAAMSFRLKYLSTSSLHSTSACPSADIPFSPWTPLTIDYIFHWKNIDIEEKYIIWYLYNPRNVEITYLDIFVCCNLGIELALLRILLRHLQQPVIHLVCDFEFHHHTVKYIQTMRAKEPIYSFLLWFGLLDEKYVTYILRTKFSFLFI